MPLGLSLWIGITSWLYSYYSPMQVVDESMETQPEASNGAGMEGGEGPTLIQEGTFAGEQIPHEEQ